MSEPFQKEVEDAVKAAGQATTIDDRAAVALAAIFYKSRDDGQGNDKFGPGWEVLSQVSPEGGYDGAALWHAKSSSLVIVNRGTEGLSSIADWMQNIRAVLLKEPGPQMQSAMELLADGFEKTRARGLQRILFCGHSLGGALADVQGALASSFIEKRGQTCPPVRTVGVASAGFAAAGRRYAEQQGLKPDTTAQAFIIHYVRGEDLVPKPGSRFGVDQKIASVYEARHVQRRGRGRGWIWRRVAEPLRQHKRTLYYQFFDESAGRHIWFSNGGGSYTARTGATPTWRKGLQQPADA